MARMAHREQTKGRFCDRASRPWLDYDVEEEETKGVYFIPCVTKIMVAMRRSLRWFNLWKSGREENGTKRRLTPTAATARADEVFEVELRQYGCNPPPPA